MTLHYAGLHNSPMVKSGSICLDLPTAPRLDIMMGFAERPRAVRQNANKSDPS